LEKINNYNHRLIQHVSRMDRPRIGQAVTKYQLAGNKRKEEEHRRKF